MPKICYVDDEVEDRPFGGKRYQERLSRAEGVECELIPPPEWEELDQFVESPPDLFLIDYELSLVQPGGRKAAYQGTTLAAEIRARLPDCPIVLITRETVLDGLGPQTRRQLTERMQICDELIFKSMLDDDLDKTRRLLLSIADGFRILRDASHNTWEPLVRTLEANDEEAALLREAAPPLQEGQWIVTGAANWIRNVVLRFPGVLYDPVNAATRLGISEEAFLSDEVQELVRPAMYDGVFAPVGGRWWKGRLLRVARQLAGDEGVDEPTNRAFAEAFYRRFERELSPTVCVWDHKPIADWVCYILRKPVKITYSLRYYPDNRPSIMDDARVSFRAIRESNEFDEGLLDAEGSRLVREIEALPEP